jgi:putative transposase
MFGLQPLVDVVKRAGVFKRNRTPLETKVLAALLCFAGLSYRGVAKAIGGISYGLVYRAFTAIRDAKPERRYRRCIAVDETKVKQILEYCENKPLFLVDKGPWYREAFERLGLEYRHETQGA